MILYHGSNQDFSEIDLNKSKPNKDFGQGFYLSREYTQAMDAQNIIILTTEGGEVISNVLHAAPGQQVNLKAKPEPDYELDELRVVNNEGDELVVKTIEDPTEGLIYYFFMKGESVQVFNTFKSTKGPETAVNGVQADGADADLYDLSGRKVNAGNVRPGIYIRNGKKIVIKRK